MGLGRGSATELYLEVVRRLRAEGAGAVLQEQCGRLLRTSELFHDLTSKLTISLVKLLPKFPLAFLDSLLYLASQPQ